MGTAEQVLGAPQHPYTQALLAAVPQIPALAAFPVTRRVCVTTDRRWLELS